MCWLDKNNWNDTNPKRLVQNRWVHRIVTPNLKATPGTNSYENTHAYFCKFIFSVK